MPARAKNRRRKRTRKRIDKKKYKQLFKLFLVVIIFVSLTVLYYFVYKESDWPEDKNFGITVFNGEQNVDLYLLKPAEDKMVKFIIPGSTQVEVSRNYGLIQLKNVWKLSRSEGLEGKLLQETATRYFYLPTNAYAKIENIELDEGGLVTAFEVIFNNYDSNLKLADKIKVAQFIIGIKNIDKLEYDLTTTNLLKRIQLKDGTVGYSYTEPTSQEISSYFHDDLIVQTNPRIKVVNRTGKNRFVEDISPLFEVLGAKIAFFKNDEVSHTDCFIYYRREDQAAVFNRYFDCELELIDEQSNYDLIFEFGNKFWMRY